MSIHRLMEGEEDTHSSSIFDQFQTVMKFELIGISIQGIRDPTHIVCINSQTHETK